MRRTYPGSALFFFSLIALAGCGDFFTDRDDSTGGGGSSRQFAYVAHFNGGGQGTIAAFRRDTTSGSLTAVGTAVNAGAGTAWLALHPNGRFLYAANEGGGISGFSVNTTSGELAALQGSPFGGGGTNFVAIAIDPQGRFLYAADNALLQVVAFSIDSNTGALAVIGSATPLPGAPVSVAVEPTGKFVYAPMSDDGIAVMRIETTGAATVTSTVPPNSGRRAEDIAFTPTGNFAFVADGVSGVASYSVNTATGALTQVAGSPVAAGTTPISITAEPSGRFVYVGNRASNNISGYAILANGSLTPLADSPYATGVTPVALRVDAGSKFLYSVNFDGNPDVRVFSIDTAVAGKLVPASTATSGPDPAYIALTR